MMVTTSLVVCHGFVRDNRNAIVHRPNQLLHGKLPLTVDEGLPDVVCDEGGHHVDGGVNLFLHDDQLLDLCAPLGQLLELHVFLGVVVHQVPIQRFQVVELHRLQHVREAH